jgi:hydrophobic/amphiphilic exporter-1 (mainly G- bacteria), HAE1 family
MIRLAIRRPVAIAMAYIAVALLGVAAWRNIPIEHLPDTTLPRLHVSAAWPGASPEATEAFVTSPLEAAIQQVRGVERVTSTSDHRNGRGFASIQIEFVRGTPMEFARLDLSERIVALERELPRDVQGPWVQAYVPPELRDRERPFLQYTITGPYTVEALRAHVDDVIAPELRRLDGVADVSVEGGRRRLLEVELDENRVRALGLELERVRRAIRELEYVREAGIVNVGGRMHTLALRHEIASAADVRRLPLLTDRGRIVRLGDVATVHDTFEDPEQHYRVDGQPAVSFIVHRRSGTNSVAVADRAKAAVDDLAPLHPAGVRLFLDGDQSQMIRAQLTDLRLRALIAGVVVFLVLLAFLRTLRSAAIVFATIAFSVLITLNLMYFGGHTLNVLTLMGLAMGFGLIVDNAIVVLENIYRRHRGGEAAAVAAEHGARDVVLAVIAATLTTLVALVPFVYLQGELRAYYVPLAIVVGFSLLASLFVAFSFIPGLAAKLLDARARQRTPATAAAEPGPDARGAARHSGAAAEARRARAPVYVRAYEHLVRATLRYPWAALVLAVLLFGGSYWIFRERVSTGVLWRPWWEQRSELVIQITLPRGDELERVDAIAAHFEERLRELPGIDRFVSRVMGQAARINITFPADVEASLYPEVLKERLTALSHQFGGADVRVYGYGPSFYGGAAMPPTYSATVLGYNYERVRDITEVLGRRFERFARVRDVNTNATGRWYERDRATELVLTLDRRRLALHDITAADVVQQVAAAVRGQGSAEPLRVGGEELSFSVKFEGHRRIDDHALLELLLPGRGGEAVRLGDVASLHEQDVLARIVRENQQYQRRLTYEFRGPRRLGDVIHNLVIESTELPPGYAIQSRDDSRWLAEERAQIYGVLIVALLLIFMVTAALFESLRQPLCVILAVPMALVGVFLLFAYTGASFTREAYIGVIMMGGIVVNNAILLVDHVNALRRRAGLPLLEAVQRGTLERVRPILMTSTTTVLGLLPLVLFSRSADANIWNALGYSLIGGLTSATVLVLTVTPALYLIFERGPERRRLRRRALGLELAGPADRSLVGR